MESFNNLSILASDPSYAVTVINADSNYLSVAALETPLLVPANNSFPPSSPPTGPYTGEPFLTGGYDGVVLDPTADGTNGGLFMTALNSDGSGTGGVHLLDSVGIFNLLCVPGESQAVVIGNLQSYCYGQKAFYIVGCPEDSTVASLGTGPAGSGTGSLTGQYSMNSAYYFPWVHAPDPLVGNRTRYFLPCGFIAGIYAATDASQGVWKAPAGIDASLTGVSALQYPLTDIDNGNLNLKAVNCLRQFNVYGNVVWSARTLQGNDQAGSQLWIRAAISCKARAAWTCLYLRPAGAAYSKCLADPWSQHGQHAASYRGRRRAHIPILSTPRFRNLCGPPASRWRSRAGNSV